MNPLHINKKEWRVEIFRTVKPFFRQYLGQYTHKKISEDWHFHSLAFVREEMTYVFGFNIGFFRKGKERKLRYTHVGMNVLVRTNGENPSLRMKYRKFFENNLHNWINMPKSIYTSFRGGVGIELPRMIHITDFSDENQIIYFLVDSIKKLNKSVYPKIAQNPDKIFSLVVRGAPLWDVTIVDLARELIIKKTN